MRVFLAGLKSPAAPAQRPGAAGRYPGEGSHDLLPAKAKAAEPCWAWFPIYQRHGVPVALLYLVREGRSLVTLETAQQTLDWLRRNGFEVGARDNHMMPVEVVDYSGNAVELLELVPFR
jgi:hypothetical protein